MNKKQLQRTEQWLDERFSFIKHEENGKTIVDSNSVYYEGAIEAIVFLGLSWKRDEEGKHILFK